MNSKILHIVSFDNPYPPNYGGRIDVFYKIKALKALGCSITLHCFLKNGETLHDELLKHVEKVHTYPFQHRWYNFLSLTPYSVLCRKNDSLLKNLKNSKAPVLFEGLKSTYGFESLTNPCFLRLHNKEDDYYYGLFKSESNFFKKIIYWTEALKYRSYQNKINKVKGVFSLSKAETRWTSTLNKNTAYVPVFHGNEKVEIPLSRGAYAMYHGDLTSPDNFKTALFLIDVFNELPNFQLLIAGNLTEADFKKKMHQGQAQVKYLQIQSFKDLQEMLQTAQIHISWSFQQSGTKLKALNALMNSRFNIINSNVIDDERLYNICSVCNSKDELKTAIKALYTQDFTFENLQERIEVMETLYSDKNNARLLLELLGK